MKGYFSKETKVGSDFFRRCSVSSDLFRSDSISQSFLVRVSGQSIDEIGQVLKSQSKSVLNQDGGKVGK